MEGQNPTHLDPRSRVNLLPRSILLVEDDPDCRAALAELFQLWGYQVEAAGDGKEGLKLAYLHRPAIAVIDIGLPDISGYQVALELRALSLRFCPLLVALTGRSEDRDRRQALSSGFDIYLTKPAGVSELRELLRSS
jgi:two-component system CheB/CheR fusion protein